MPTQRSNVPDYWTHFANTISSAKTMKTYFPRLDNEELKSKLSIKIRGAPFKSSDEALKKSIARFSDLERNFPTQFDAFHFVINHGFWDERKDKSCILFLVNLIKDRGGVKWLAQKNDLRAYIAIISQYGQRGRRCIGYAQNKSCRPRERFGKIAHRFSRYCGFTKGTSSAPSALVARRMADKSHVPRLYRFFKVARR